jgi:hypothetical protein
MCRPLSPFELFNTAVQVVRGTVSVRHYHLQPDPENDPGVLKRAKGGVTHFNRIFVNPCG